VLPPEPDDYQKSVLHLRRLFHLGLWLVAALWLLLIPGAQVWMGYSALQSEGKARTGMAADRLSSYVSSHLETWEYETERLLYMSRDSLRGGATTCTAPC